VFAGLDSFVFQQQLLFFLSKAFLQSQTNNVLNNHLALVLIHVTVITFIKELTRIFRHSFFFLKTTIWTGYY